MGKHEYGTYFKIRRYERSFPERADIYKPNKAERQLTEEKAENMFERQQVFSAVRKLTRSGQFAHPRRAYNGSEPGKRSDFFETASKRKRNET